ncbi:thiamine phosphate synthase [SAR202 cluster bacterium AD-802-E10_MRT_200m]|nr:thiamine phosphate synthase [SAR202 cluster bacterium AD-802-E10_MRT_200m]
MPNLPNPCLLLVTDRSLCPATISFPEYLNQLVNAGVNAIQIREKDLSTKDIFLLIEDIKSRIENKAMLIVNDRLDIALACNLDGVQIGENGFPLEVARKITQNNLLLGRSVHNLTGAVEAEACGADFLIVGTIYKSRSHPESLPAGPQLLEQVTQAVALPCLAIGGINVSNAQEVIRAGASGIAIISAVQGAQDPENVIKDLRYAIASVL